MDSASRASGLSPPVGYESWLVYAVAMLDTREVELRRLFSDEEYVSRDEIRMAVWEELNELRERAGLHRIDPASLSSTP